MLRGLKTLRGYGVETIDGVTGSVEDFYFDDSDWMLRYLVADTGRWLPGRRVLLSPASLRKPNWERRRFPVDLTIKQLRESPDINTHKPVLRKHEIELARYYNWPSYWMGGFSFGSGYDTSLLTIHREKPSEQGGTATQEKVDSHLRSAGDVVGYGIRATDGEIGHLDDFIVSDNDWRIHYIVVDTRNWLPGRKVLVAPLWIDEMHWDDARVKVGLTRDSIQRSPEYNSSEPVNEEYERRLYDYYGRPKG